MDSLPPQFPADELLKRFVCLDNEIPWDQVPPEDREIARGALLFREKILQALQQNQHDDSSAPTILQLREAIDVALHLSAPVELHPQSAPHSPNLPSLPDSSSHQKSKQHESDPDHRL